MSEKPKYILSRDGDDITITISNRDDRETVVYRSDQHNKTIASISTIDADTFNETISSGLNAGYVLRFKDIDVSITITEDNTDETPPWYEATAKSGVTFTPDTATFDPSWDSEITYDIISVTGLLEGTKSKRKYTKE